jgi:hypothetical protein
MAKLKDGRQAAFLWIDNRVIREHGAAIGASGIAVYCCLAMHANKKRECFPSYKTIHEYTGLSRATISGALKILKARGLLAVHGRTERGLKRSNFYVLLDPPEPDLFSQPTDQPQTEPAADAAGEPACSSIAEPRGSVVELLGSSVAELEQEPLEQDPKEQTPPNPQRGSEREFEAFWNAYPKKRGREKALRVWRRLNPSLAIVETILAAVARQALWPDWRREDGRYIPCPAKWLRGRRWEDQGTTAETVPRETEEQLRERRLRERKEFQAKYGLDRKEAGQ